MKLEPILTPIDVEDNQDSYVYKLDLPRGKEAIKMYGSHSQETLRLYGEIQNILSVHVMKGALPEEIYFENVLIKDVVVKILNIPEDSVEGSFIGEGIRFKQPILITNPTYIEGKTIADYNDNDFGGKKDLIQNMLNNFFQQIADYEGLTEIDLALINVKIVSFQGGTLQLLITDVSCDINHTVNANSQSIGFDLGYVFRSIFSNHTIG